MSCILCRTLYFDAVQTQCGHRFCRECIGQFRDCPLCGNDTAPLTPDVDLQGWADSILLCPWSRVMLALRTMNQLAAKCCNTPCRA